MFRLTLPQIQMIPSSSYHQSSYPFFSSPLIYPYDDHVIQTSPIGDHAIQTGFYGDHVTQIAPSAGHVTLIDLVVSRISSEDCAILMLVFFLDSYKNLI